MHNLFLFAAAAAVSVDASAIAPRSYLNEMSSSYIKRGADEGFHYGEATLYTGLESTYFVNKNESIKSWYKNQIDTGLIYENGSIIDWPSEKYSLDNYRIGNNLLWWYEKTGEAKYKTAAKIIRDQIDRHPRNTAGGFWHRKPDYPNQMWLDGIFMTDSFYAKWTKAFDAKNATAWNDIILQYDLIEEHTRNHTSNLLVHGYDHEKEAVWADPETGAAPLVWGRAVGWYYLSLLEAIDYFPKSHKGHARLVKYFQTLSEGLKKSAERDGGWWLIMSETYPKREGNYIESSAHAMFTAGLLKGIRTGLLKKSKFTKLAQKAYNSMIDDFVTENDDGTLNFIETVQVGSLSSNGTYEYYIGVPRVINDNRGGGAFLLAASEWERQNKH